MKRLFIAALLLLCVMLTAPAFSQTNAILNGTVADKSGGVIPGVSVTATNNATGVVSNTFTNNSGVYSFPSLSTGVYTVTVEQDGFQPKKFTDVQLRSAARVTLNFDLEVAGVETQVQVTSSAKDMLLETSSSSGDVLSFETVQELPLVNRDALELIDVMSGVIKTDDTIFNANSSSFAGVGANGVNIQRDGVTVNDVRWPAGINAATRVNPDLVGEFKMVLAPVDAEMGRGNAQLQITTRQGTNSLHGNAVWTVQNTALDPNTWENNRRNVEPPWRNLHMYSASASGPIIKNKTFFFVLFDGQLNKIRTPYNVLTLTPCARQGIFRYYDNWNNGNSLPTQFSNGSVPIDNVVDINGNATPPRAELPSMVGPNGELLEGAIAHNGILRYASIFGEILNPDELTADCSNVEIGDIPWDPNRPVQDPTGFVSDFIDMMPTPNNYDIGDGLNTAGHRWSRTLLGADNLFGVGEDTYRRQINIRIDHNFNDKHRINGSWSWEKSWADDNFKNWPNGYGGKSERRPQVLTVNFISSLKPTLLNEFRFGMSRTGSNISSPYTNPDTGSIVQELLPKTGTGVPVITGLGNGNVGFRVDSANGFSNFYGGRGILSYSGIDTSPRWSFGDTISWTKGTHSFRFGGDFRRASSLAENSWTGPFFAGYNSYPYAQGGGAVQGLLAGNFPGVLTGINNTNGNVNTMENLLVFHSGSIGEIRQWRYINDVNATVWNDPVAEPTLVRDVVQKEYSLFFKDDWKVTPDFTLNLGLRYDYYGVPYLKNGLTTGLAGGGGALFGLTGGYDNWFAPIGQGDVPTGDLTELEFIGPGTPNAGKSLYATDTNNFGPAVGFSWQLPFFGKGKTTIRGGYQLNYIGSVGNFSGIQTNAGQAPGTTYSNIYYGAEGDDYLDLTDLNALGNEIPIPSGIVPGLAAFPLFNNSQSITIYSPDYVTPYIQNITFGVSRNVTNNLTVDVRYIGTLTRKNYATLDLNLPNFLSNGLLEAYDAARAGGNPELLDELLMGQQVVPWNPNVVDGETYFGGQMLREAGFFIGGIPFFRPGWFANVNSMLANGDYASLTNALSYLGGGGAYLEDNGFPVNFFKANPQFDQASFSNNNGHSNYHSMQLMVTLRPTAGVNFTSTYTLSKNLGRTGLTDPRNINLDYTLLPADRTHNWVTYGGWELPFGQGRMFGNDMAGVWDRIIGGWNLSWIGTVQSGSPLNITASNMLYGNGVPDLVGDFDMDAVGTYWPDGAAAGNYFANRYATRSDAICSQIDVSLQGLCTLREVYDLDTDEAVLRTPAPGTIGSFGRGKLRNLTRWNVDLSMSKMFRVDETKSFRIRLDASNVFNKVFASGALGGTGTRIVFPTSPDTSINSGNFGQMPYKVGGRTFQMMMRFDF